MSAAPILASFGGDLTEADYRSLEARWITRELADAAGLRRVDSTTGQQLVGRKRGDFAGILIPYSWPEENRIREYRIRRDSPDVTYDTNGQLKEEGKYMSPPGRGSLVYFPPDVPSKLITEPATPLIITEGEFKAMALWRLANHLAASPRFGALALAGCWNWRGTIGKTTGPNGDRRDVKGVIPDLDRICWKGRRVIIAFDADAEDKPQVRAARWQLSSVLISRGAVVGVLEWSQEHGKGIDDWLANCGPERVLEAIAAVEYGDWHTKLLRTEEGRVIPCYENVALYLENSPDWAGVLAYNEFTAGYEVLRQPPQPVTAEVGSEIEDHFDTEVTRWLERRRVMVKPEVVRRVIDGIARRNSYHPVRDYLEALQWDGTPRIANWLIDYCGVASSDENPNVYAMAVGEKFLISAIARALQPGCKADHLLILEGPQGIGKSTLARTLAGDGWFSDQLADMGSKDAAMQLRGVWIVELSELDVLSRAERARAKAFLSQQTERFRLPYGRRIIQAPRQCVFLGTTNADNWLKDETGGRRFWPVRCRAIDLSAVKRDRDQLWAEAVHRFRAGASWWLDDPDVVSDAMDEQRARYDTDPWHESIAEYVAGRDEVSTVDIFEHVLRKPVDQRSQADKNRVVSCLRVLGLERYKKRVGSQLQWRYRKADA